MILVKLSSKTEKLSKHIRDILLYSHISDATVEIGSRQTSFTPTTIFVNENKYRTLEDVLSAFAERIYDHNIHYNFRPSTKLWLQSHLSAARAGKVAAVVEKAVEPDILFGLNRYSV